MASNTVNLRCNICPKTPKFSDVSHLLTHVSSKGHLSHYFKLQVRSHQEPEASQMLLAYDRWYQDNNLAELLSERMLSKESRKSRSHSRLSSVPNVSTPAAPVPHQKGSKQNRQVPDFLDPRLAQPYFDPDQHAKSLDRPRAPNSFAHVARHPTAPPAHLWAANANRRSTLPNPRVPQMWKPERDLESDDDMSPIVRTRRPTAIPKSMSKRQQRASSPDPFVDDSSLNNGGEKSVGKGTDEMSKLKGVLWPGMNIFDSATEQMRRKRNQKKDGTMLKRMEKTSEDIEPTELVFSPNGTLRKQRLISGMVEDSSPLKGETPIPKRRVVRPKRAPLARTDPNTFNPAGLGGRNGKPSFNQQAQTLAELSRQTLPLIDSPTIDRSFRYFDSNYSPAVDDNTDFRLTFGGFDQKKPRRGFTVFSGDEPQMKATRGDEMHMRVSDKRRQKEPTFGSYLNPSSLSQHSQPQTFSGFPAKDHSSQQFRVLNAPSSGKENIEPMMTSGGRIDSITGPGIWPNHRHAVDADYRSQYFFGASPQDFEPFPEPDMGGYSCNPLSYSMHPMQIVREHDHVRDPRDSTVCRSLYYGDAKVDHEALTDATVSDAEKEDIGRLYFDGVSE